MIEITKEIEQLLLEKIKLGHYSEYGAIGVEDNELTLVYKNTKIYLALKSEFEFVEPFFVRLKNICPCDKCSNHYFYINADDYTGIKYDCKLTCTLYLQWLENEKNR